MKQLPIVLVEGEVVVFEQRVQRPFRLALVVADMPLHPTYPYQSPEEEQTLKLMVVVGEKKKVTRGGGTKSSSASWQPPDASHGALVVSVAAAVSS